MASTTPFHDLAEQLRTIAGQVETLGDQVHTGTYTVPVPEPEAEQPPQQSSADETENPDDPTTPSKTGDAEQRARTSEKDTAPAKQRTSGGAATSTG